MTIYDKITVITLYSNNSKLFNKKKFLIKIFYKKKKKDFDKKITKSREKKSIEKKPILKKIHSKKKLKLQKNWNFD